MSKYTPGPWFWVHDPDGTPWGREKVKLVNKDGIEICSFGFDSNDNPRVGKEPNEYDKRLIETAPDLLKAAEAALIGAKHEACGYESPDLTWHCCDWNEVVKMLEDVIAKAKGEEQQ